MVATRSSSRREKRWPITDGVLQRDLRRRRQLVDAGLDQLGDRAGQREVVDVADRRPTGPSSASTTTPSSTRARAISVANWALPSARWARRSRCAGGERAGEQRLEDGADRLVGQRREPDDDDVGGADAAARTAPGPRCR